MLIRGSCERLTSRAAPQSPAFRVRCMATRAFGVAGAFRPIGGTRGGSFLFQDLPILLREEARRFGLESPSGPRQRSS
jgi:hypothetical protein